MRIAKYNIYTAVFSFMMFCLSGVAQASWFGPNVDAVKNELADPYSAKFENVKKLKSGAVCGEVNYKNQYGAYIGRQPFAIWNEKAFIGESGAEGVLLYCVKSPQCINEECVRAVSNADLPISIITKCDTKECIDTAVEAQKQKEMEVEAEKTFKAMLTTVQKQCLSHLPDNPDLMLSCNSKLHQCRGIEVASERLSCLKQILEGRAD